MRGRGLHLAEQAQQVFDVPDLGDLATAKSGDVDTDQYQTLPGGTNAEEIVTVRASQGPPADNRISLGDQVINRNLDVGQGCVESSDSFRMPGTIGSHTVRRRMVPNRAQSIRLRH